MRGSLSPEGQIQKGLILIGCSETAFCKIAGFTQSNFSVIMAGQKDFTVEQADELRELLSEMTSLQLHVGRDVPIAWTNTVKVKDALFVQRIKRIGQELGFPDFENLTIDTPTLVRRDAMPDSQAILSPNGAAV
jgi:hypothetical protein